MQQFTTENPTNVSENSQSNNCIIVVIITTAIDSYLFSTGNTMCIDLLFLCFSLGILLNNECIVKYTKE